MLGRLEHPFGGLLLVAGDVLVLQVQLPELELGAMVLVARGLLEEVDGLVYGLLDSDPLEVHLAEVERCVDVLALVGVLHALESLGGVHVDS